MPETRYIRHFDINGQELPPTPYQVSDAQLALEAIEHEVQVANDQALVAYQHWATLTLAQKDAALKALVGDYIVRNRSNYGG